MAPTLAGAVNSSSSFPTDKDFWEGSDELLVKLIDLWGVIQARILCVKDFNK